jgi:cysteine-rich repeat protein
MIRFAPIACCVALLACGDNLVPELQPDATMAVCGNFKLEPGEDCDDGDTVADGVCGADCHFTCGNGTVDDAFGETCDTGITSGPGACPTNCDDQQACTTDVLSENACQTICIHTAITAAVDGDGCCPSGANANTDNDCVAMCGNGILEPGEICDTGIIAGAGACPTSCDDQQSCTTDTLMNPASCQAVCSHTNITQPANNDGCCPPGATSANDNDCKASCGNGVVDPGETCDTAITTGAGKCPTTCSDGMVCTTDVLSNPATCTAKCVFTPITTPANNDGCCPTGANANNDNDCVPRCGNGVMEAGEACDDGNTNNNDACSNTCTVNTIATAFRFSDLDLRDPHVFVSFLGCRDVTDTQLVGFSVNNEIQKNIQTDGNTDGFLDLSPTLVFRPLSQGNTTTSPVDVYFASCTAPIASTSCKPGTQAPLAVTATAQTSGTCLAPIAGTTHGYTPAITSASAPCFATSATTLTISIGGIPITLHDARVGATFVGNPATSLTNGLLIGFISETDANATIIPMSFPLVGGQPLSSLLPGGSGNCASFSDKDTDAGVVGWYFYLNFPATRVPWSDM